MYESLVKFIATGNCGEQAAVAAYRAIEIDGSVRETTWVAGVTAPGDHAFCVVGVAGPTWKTVAAMANDVTNMFGIVIDPWMHLVCYAPQYPKVSGEKMQKWLAAGKRISWTGNDGNANGWYQPSGNYAARLLDSTLRFEKAV